MTQCPCSLCDHPHWGPCKEPDCACEESTFTVERCEAYIMECVPDGRVRAFILDAVNWAEVERGIHRFDRNWELSTITVRVTPRGSEGSRQWIPPGADPK